MKKSTIAFILVVLLLGAYFTFDAKWGRFLFHGLFSEDLKNVGEASLSFMEDIKFKDFKNAASYHHPDDQEKVDIPKLIEKKFQVKPELIDIMYYDILETSIDSSGKRARVKIKAKASILNTGKIKKPEFMLYFKKRDGKWYMELESSLK